MLTVVLSLQILAASPQAASPQTAAAPTVTPLSGDTVAAGEREDDTGGLATRIFAADPCLSLWQQLTCIGLSMIDQECLGGKGTAIYSLAVIYAGIGSVGGFAAGCLGGMVPGGLYASSQYAVEAPSLGPDQALLNAVFAFFVVAFVCGGAGSLAGIVLAGSIGVIHGLILLFTGQLEQTGPLAGLALPEQDPKVGRSTPTYRY